MPGVDADIPPHAPPSRPRTCAVVAVSALLAGLLLLPSSAGAEPLLGTCTARDAQRDALWRQELDALRETLARLDRDALLLLTADALTLHADPPAAQGPITLTLADDDATALTFTRLDLRDDGALAFEDLTLQGRALSLSADTLLLTRDGIALTGARATLRDGPRRARLSAATVHLQADRLSLADATLSPCGCAGEDTDSLLLAAARVEVARGDDPVDLEDVELIVEALGAVALPVADLRRDGRGSGLLLPHIGWGSALGFTVELPAFLRLSEHADLRLALGWATARGPTARSRLRVHASPADHGEIDLAARYDIDPEALTIWTRGLLTSRPLRALHLLLELDVLSDLRLHDELRRDLASRARRYGRSRAVVAWSTPSHHLALHAGWLQQRPRRSLPLTRGALQPLIDGAPALQRLPLLRYAGGALLPGDIRLDLDARYAFLSPTHGTPFLDWGAGGPERSSIGLRSPGDLAGDGLQEVELEPSAEGHLVTFDAALRWPIDLAGFGHLILGAGFSERSLIHESRADHRVALDLSAALTTTLLRRFEAGVHSITPSVTWRARPLTLGAPSPLPLPTLDPERATHNLALSLENRFTAPGWILEAELGWVLLPDDDADPLGLVHARVDWRADALRIEASLGTRVAEADAPWWSVAGAVQGPGGIEARLSHALMGGALTSWGSRPSPLRSVGPWRPLRLVSPLSEGAATSALELTWSGARLNASLLAALLHPREAAELETGVELGAGLGLTGACRCWRAGIRGARHANAPRWDLSATFELLAP